MSKGGLDILLATSRFYGITTPARESCSGREHRDRVYGDKNVFRKQINSHRIGCFYSYGNTSVLLQLGLGQRCASEVIVGAPWDTAGDRADRQLRV